MDGTRECVCAKEERPAIAYRPPQRAWAGHGTGARCDLCGDVIEPNQIEYEVELQSAPVREVLYMHLDCYYDWATHT